MNILIFLIAVWMGVIPLTLKEAEATPVIVGVDYAEPCYDAPCSKTCQYGASFTESIACDNTECRHNNDYHDGKVRCEKTVPKEISDEEGYTIIRSCNGFKREALECKMPEYKS